MLNTIAFDRTHTAQIVTDIKAIIRNAAKNGAAALQPASSRRAFKPAVESSKPKKARPAAQFKPGKLHSLSAEGNLAFMGIPASVLHHIFRDGRICGLLMEHALQAQFNNITVVSDKRAPYDLFMTDAQPGAQRFEHKVATNDNGADLAPSAMKGTGRKWNRKAFVKRMMQIDGVIVTDITNFPEVRVRSFSKAELSAMKYPRYLTVDAVVPKAKKK